MRLTERRPLPEKRRAHHGTLRWGEWQARKNAHVGCGEQLDDTDNLTEAQRFETWLWNARNEWSVRSRSGLLGSGGRIGKHDADRALKQELAKLAKAGVE
jgi:hypothetical protein